MAPKKFRGKMAGNRLTTIVGHLGVNIGIIDARKGGSAKDPGEAVDRARAEVQAFDQGRWGGLQVAHGVREVVVPEDAVDGPEEGVVLAAAPVGEVVEVEGPGIRFIN
jgi:hypothetical protein